MDFRKKIISIILVAILLEACFTPFANATDWATAAEWAANTALKAAAQAVYRNVTNQIISKIQTAGENGKPAFVQNWISYLTQSQYKGEGIFRAELSTAHLCDYLSTDIKKTFGVDPNAKTPLAGQNTRTDSSQPFNLQANCTMPAGFTPQKYQQDFAGNGGWDTFSRMLEPQNNSMGLMALSQDEMTKQRSLAESAATDEANGTGFTGAKGACKLQGPGGICLISGDILTPGSILDQGTANALNGSIGFLTTADAASGAIAALVNFATDKLFNLSASTTSNSSTSDVQTTNNSYNQEFCTAKDDMSLEAKTYISKTFPQAYKNFPPGGGSSLSFLPGHSNGTGSYCQSLNDSNNPAPYTRCVVSCEKAVSSVPNNVEVSSPPPIASTAPPEKSWACTQLVTDEPNFMLPLLQAIPAMNPITIPASQIYQDAVQSVVSQANAKFGAQTTALGETTDGTAVLYYPNNGTIGAPEFYLAGPIPGRTVSPQTGLPWDVVVRCTR